MLIIPAEGFHLKAVYEEQDNEYSTLESIYNDDSSYDDLHLLSYISNEPKKKIQKINFSVNIYIDFYFIKVL